MIATLFLAFFGVRAFAQTLSWRETEALWYHTLEVNPKSWLAYNDLGSFHEKKQEWAAALAYYNRAAELRPIPIFFNNVGTMAMNLGRIDEARAAFEHSIAADPDSPVDYLNLSLVKQATHDPEGAERVLEQAIQRIPGSLELRAALRRLPSSTDLPPPTILDDTSPKN